MNSNDFDIIVKERCESIVKTLSKKAEEYASGDDRFHNFNVAARKRNTSPEKALMGMKVKHDVAVDDLVEWAVEAPEKLTLELIEEKIGDSINYLVLLEGLLKRRICPKKALCMTNIGDWDFTKADLNLMRQSHPSHKLDHYYETSEGAEEEKYE